MLTLVMVLGHAVRATQAVATDCVPKSGQALASAIAGKAILAPLTRGGTPAFRALCVAHGAEVTMGEMSFARFLVKGDRQEVARMRRHATESLFGAQIATKTIDEGVAAAEIAAKNGADWVDLNCGCPIHEATRRGLGSALLRKPPKLARLVGGLVDSSPIPVSVKIRLSPSSEEAMNFAKIVAELADLGSSAPAFVTLHGRTANARYRTPANWSFVEKAAREHPLLPVVGNGDVLTHYEAEKRRLTAPSAAALMVGRGALITPWIFEEIKSKETWLPTPEERVHVYFHLASLFKAHFGDDERGKRSADYFWPWHFDFLHRWRPLPEAHFADLALRYPLVQSSRDIDQLLHDVVEGPSHDLDPLEQLLRCPLPDVHRQVADALWAAASAPDAVFALRRLASAENLALWAQARLRASDPGRNDEKEGRS